MVRILFLFFSLCVVNLWTIRADAAFDLDIHIPLPSNFTPTQLANLQASLDMAEELWEEVITGYQSGINLSGVSIAVDIGSDFAAATPPANVFQGGFHLATNSMVFINPTVIDNYFAWTGAGFPNPNPDYLGKNYLDDILAHEIGHALGIGTLWEANGVYALGTGHYLGEYGLTAYQAEFDLTATFVPVELAGNPGTIDNHWNQLMRSSSQEGNPSNPFILSPLTGTRDSQGRDFAMELMTGAIDPDYGQPFLSQTTIQSLRDLGFTVVPEPATELLLFCAAISVGCRRRMTLERA